ncbi:hypothetical protein [Nostoc sp. FACHB-110]|uniref:hypothetical protein n=1 Tax=Nostoc sp. FACHB-110 TaxID=2692834 RepID=UPI001682C6C9|nr:hypothetical protein [Nostoc sp. FACHB-110]MBD2440642.1 hypothetical protein [Nostoc sp. FACHB-110]
MSDRQSIYINIDSQSEMAVKRIVDKIISSGKMSRQDHNYLVSAVLYKGEIRDKERRQINRVFDHIQTGQLKIID